MNKLIAIFLCTAAAITFAASGLDRVSRSAHSDETRLNAAKKGIKLSSGAKLCFDGDVLKPIRCMIFNGTDFTLLQGGLKIEHGALQVSNSIKFALKNPLPTCVESLEGGLHADSLSGGKTGIRTRLCLCTSDGAARYAWQNIVTAGIGSATTCP